MIQWATPSFHDYANDYELFSVFHVLLYKGNTRKVTDTVTKGLQDFIKAYLRHVIEVSQPMRILLSVAQ